MYNLTNEINELDLLIESTKEEFNDYAESLLNEYAFDEVRPLLESAHFEAELIITEAEDEQVNKIKEAGEEAKDKVDEKFNSPAYTKKCKEIEDAIKEDPSVGEQLVEVPDVDKICKEIVSSAKKGEELDKAALSQSETITLKQLMLKRKRIQTIIGVTIGVVATAGAMLVAVNISNKIKSKNERAMNTIKKMEDNEDEMFAAFFDPEHHAKKPFRKNHAYGKADAYKMRENAEIRFNNSREKAKKKGKLAQLISVSTALATSIYSVIMGIKIHKVKKVIKKVIN